MHKDKNRAQKYRERDAMYILYKGERNMEQNEYCHNVRVRPDECQKGWQLKEYTEVK
jgi:hypothetical protein